MLYFSYVDLKICIKFNAMIISNDIISLKNCFHNFQWALQHIFTLWNNLHAPNCCIFDIPEILSAPFLEEVAG